MVLLKCVYNIRSIAKNEDGAKIIKKKITVMQQRSTEQRSTVDLRRRLTYCKILVHKCQQS